MKADKEYDARCKYCGKPFKKSRKHKRYCSVECRMKSHREIKARYQAKRRLLAKKGVLVLPEYKKYGLGSYGTSATGHRKSDFTKEYEAIQREMELLQIRKDKKKDKRMDEEVIQ